MDAARKKAASSAPNASATQAAAVDLLSNVILKLLECKPEQPLEVFSQFVSASSTDRFVPPVKDSKYARVQQSALAKNLTWDDGQQSSNRVLDLMGRKKRKEKRVVAEGEDHPETEEEAPEEEEELNESEVQDVHHDMENFGAAGVSFPAEEIEILARSIRRLGQKKPLKSVRFFGKIQTQQGHYYVAQSEYRDDSRPEEEPEAEDEDQGIQAHGKKPVTFPVEQAGLIGTNKYTFWVTTKLDVANWVELPNIRPDQILAARRIRKAFTGNLLAEVRSHPAFPGREIHLLRAQIERIIHACSVAPRGYYIDPNAAEPNDDDPDAPPPPPSMEPVAEHYDLEQNDEFLDKGISIPELLKLENFLHKEPAILQTQGRCALFTPEDEEQEEDDGKPKPPVELYPPILFPVTNDAPLQFASGGGASRPVSAWSVRRSDSLLGDSSSVVLVRSLRWPGAQSYFRCTHRPSSQRYSLFSGFIYIGDGMKFDDHSFCPDVLGQPQSEGMASELSVDPTPEMEASFREPDPPAPKVVPKEVDENAEGEGDGNEDEQGEDGAGDEEGGEDGEEGEEDEGDDY